ncbi:hypothetical protein MASR2M64_03410 [Candidatus Cloacimonadota bacterium]
MRRNIIAMLLICLLILACSFKLWAMEDMDDAFVEAEAQKDMLAYVQTTLTYRFGNDLRAGDFVEYGCSDLQAKGEEPTISSLLVTERKADIATIKEMFEGNILWYRIDLESNTLLEYWGSDEDGMEHKPTLLSQQETQTRMNAMKETITEANPNALPAGLAKPVYATSPQRETLSINQANLNCLVKSLELTNIEGITPELKQAVTELSKVYFSESVPKLLPVKIMATYLGVPDVFSGNHGLVKQSNYHLLMYVKVDK